MDHRIIIKVKCEEILRRITAYISKEEILNLDLDSLRRKVRLMFQIPTESDFRLRYIDGDGDEITLLEERDLCEAIAQNLNPLRINVALDKRNKAGCESLSKSSSSSDGWVLLDNSSSCMDYANAEAFESTEKNLGDILSRISTELVEKSASLVLCKLVEFLPKLRMSCPDLLSENQDGDDVSTENQELAKSNNNQPVQNPTCPKTAGEKLDSSLTGDCSNNCAVLLLQPSAHELFNSRFVLDLNDFKFTVVDPDKEFSKTLRLLNNGFRPWSNKSKLVWVGGDRLTDETSVKIKIPVNGHPIGSELDVVLHFRAPELPGNYTSYWKMALPSGETFGEQICIRIQVYDPSKNMKELDLNYPLKDDEGITNTTGEAKKSSPTLVTGKNKGKSKSTKNQGSGLFTNVDASNVSKAVTNSICVDEGKDARHSLLKSLEELGFKSDNLNKELLRLNSYNLQNTLTDLCGISDCDPAFTKMWNILNNAQKRKLDMKALRIM